MELVEAYKKKVFSQKERSRRGLTQLIVSLNHITDQFDNMPRDGAVEYALNKRIEQLLKDTLWIGEVTIYIYHFHIAGEYQATVGTYAHKDIEWKN